MNAVTSNRITIKKHMRNIVYEKFEIERIMHMWKRASIDGSYPLDIVNLSIQKLTTEWLSLCIIVILFGSTGI